MNHSNRTEATTPPTATCSASPASAAAHPLPADPIPVPLNLRLLNTEGCLPLLSEICDLENAVFGPDFATSAAEIHRWVEAGSFFCAAVASEAVAARSRIVAVVSAMITDEEGRDRLFRGEIADVDLPPWDPTHSQSAPSIYFASVISDHPGHLAGLYSSVAHDTVHYLDEHDIEARTAFAIAGGEAGFRHMLRSGFAALEGHLYHGRYQLLTLSHDNAKTSFWQQVLRLKSASKPALDRRSDPAVLAGEPRVNLLSEDPHEIERRLALSKAERYRQRQPRTDGPSEKSY